MMIELRLMMGRLRSGRLDFEYLSCSESEIGRYRKLLHLEPSLAMRWRMKVGRLQKR